MADDNNSFIEFGLGEFLFDDEYTELMGIIEDYKALSPLNEEVKDRIATILLLNSMQNVLNAEVALRVLREELTDALRCIADDEIIAMLKNCDIVLDVNKNT